MTTKLTHKIGQRRQRRNGFTLTEIAIVLGIVGLILGAIWAAASAVYGNLKFSQAQQGITLGAQTVRSLYASSNTTGITGTAASIYSPGMLPTSWTSSGKRGNPWNQAPSGDLSFIYGLGSKFQIELDNIDNAGCASLLNFYNTTAAASNGGQIVGLTGNLVTATATTPGTAKIGSTMATTFVPGSGCTGGANKNAVAIQFDMSLM